MLIFLDKASNPSERTLRFMLFILTLKYFMHSSFFSLFSFLYSIFRKHLQDIFITLIPVTENDCLYLESVCNIKLNGIEKSRWS